MTMRTLMIVWLLAGCRFGFEATPDAKRIDGAMGDAAFAASLVAHWPLDEAAGATVFVDASPYNNVGVCDQCPVAGLPGIRGNAIAFGAGDAGIRIVATPMLTSLAGALTISAWVRIAGVHTYGAILSNDRDCCGLYAGYSLWATHHSSGPAMMTWDGASQTFARGSPLPRDTWSHIVGTHDGTTNRIYVDGNEVAMSQNATLASPFSFDLWIGALGYAPPQYHIEDSLIDDVIVFGRALSDVEIAALYASYF